MLLSDSSEYHRKLFTNGGFKMNANRYFLPKKSQYEFPTLLLIFFLFCLISVFSPGCKKNDAKGMKPEATLQNLQTAFNREMRISREYALFSKNAENNRFSAIANLYKAVSRSEDIHAEMAATLLRSKGVDVIPYSPDSIIVGTVMQTLRMALSDESLESDSMYPNLSRTAKAEKFLQAAESFGHALNVDTWNAVLFKDDVDRSGYIARVQYYVCPCCGYVITSNAATECPECHEKQEKFEKI